MSDAKIGHSITFKIQNAASPVAMVSIGEVESLSMPALARDAVEVTHMSSPEKWREFIAGLKDGGEVTAEIHFVPGSVGALLLMAQFDTDDPSVCEIGLPMFSPAYEWNFNAILTGLPPEASVDGKQTASVTFKVTGKPTLTVVS